MSWGRWVGGSWLIANMRSLEDELRVGEEAGKGWGGEIVLIMYTPCSFTSRSSLLRNLTLHSVHLDQYRVAPSYYI